MADAPAMLTSAAVCAQQKSKLVVVSATSGTTNQLIEIGQRASAGKWEEAQRVVLDLKTRHLKIAAELDSTSGEIVLLQELMQELEALAMGVWLLKEVSPRASDNLVSLGERMSSILFLAACRQHKLLPQLLDAREYIVTDSQFTKASPNISKIKERVEHRLLPLLDSEIVFVTQGFIGATADGATTTLGRGGSDYSAALFAEALSSPVCEIWTDVPGVASTDPRICKEAKFITELSFEETAEMASLGAKVLHPATLLPAIRRNIPVFVGSTFDTKAGGTYITKKTESEPRIRAITLKRKQTLITLTNPEMAYAHGFLFNIYKIFHENKISVDAITTSQISVAMTIDDPIRNNQEFIDELKTVASLKFEENCSLISVVGYEITNIPELLEVIFSVTDKKTIKMVCFGASRFSLNLLVKDQDAVDLVNTLHNRFLQK